MKRKVAAHKPSRAEQQTYFTVRRHIGLDDHEVISALDVVRAHIATDERNIAYFQSRLSEARVALQADTATAVGLGAVLDSRR
jgi:hypothetical protein